MSEVGRLAASLRLDGAEQFQRQLQSVGQQFQEAGNQGRSFGQKGADAFKVAAGATTQLTAAAGAYLSILAKTGVEYNSLQQNSRAALKVMMGGAEQANAQMDKLDAFARNSPFAKDMFIQSQQQMLGFGIEAQKVLPYLDAIQNAVAATGGNSHKIAELSTIMSQIQSSAKITAGDLREFGNRGIDAAALIGSQMGKTATQIRDEIGSGTIDAGAALDALAAGMTEKFGGTTELVKQQWSGAVDRIKAANRDIGAVIAEPFVSKNGGGMAVTWGNQVADVLRAIEGQAKPVMEILTSRGSGMFAALTTGLDQAAASINRWNPAALETSLNRLEGHAPAIGALTGVIIALGSSVGPLGSALSMLGLSINPVVAAFVGLAAASPEVRDAFGQVLEAGKPLLPLVGEIAGILSGTLSSAMPVVAEGVGLVVSVLEPMVDLISQIPAPVLIGAAAFLALHNSMSPLAGGIGKLAEGFKRFGENAQLQAALGDTSLQIGALSAASMGAQGAVRGLGNAMKTAFLSNPVGIALTVVSAAIALWAGANAEAEAKVQEHNARVAALRDTLNATSGALTESTGAMVASNLEQTRAATLAEEMGIKYSDIQDAIMGNAAAQERVQKGMTKHWEENAVTLKESDDALNSWSASAVNARNRGTELTEIMDEQRASLEDAQAAQRAKVQADREAAAAMTDAARSNQAFNDALQVANDATQDAETRLRALKQALDELDGGSRTARQSQTDLAETALNLKDALSAVDENGARVWQSFIDGAGAIQTGTREGIAFERMLDGANDKMLQAMQAASDDAMAHNDRAGAMRDAIAVGHEHIAALEGEMRAAGLSEEAIAALVDQYFAMPELVATTFQLDGLTEAGQQIVQILDDLALVPEGKTITIANEGGEETAQILRDLGYEVTTTDDYKTITVTSQGADVVTQQLQDIGNQQVPEKIFKVDADVASAYAGLQGVEVVKINDKYSYVYGNNSDALSKIEGVNKKQPDGKVVTIGADDSGFWGAWGRIAGAAMSKIVGIGGGASNYGGGLYEPSGKQFYGGGIVGAQHYAGGGYPSGLYTGVQGGLWRMGLDGVPHNFAEAEHGVPWEVYISGKSGSRMANVGYALEALRRLGFPAIPLAALAGTGYRGFDGGGLVGAQAPGYSTPAANVPRSSPMVGQIILGDTNRNQFTELQRRLEDIDRRSDVR
ncbi:tape measure protein [Leucobacter luti]|uniref:tape measure protein n=1 Tax=Leucobacter luti TaxID=340320 RepID=UPI003D03C874